ncbi:MAG: Nif11-like leader peptide family RiPP precursor [Synechococcaceae cyanobacterium]|nr:Nif11-like leader peptide family RiPP precursor [Synechococcaceae cyanobacterium]
MSLPSLEAFLEAASTDARLQEQLASAVDAAALAAVARAAGFAVSEADWLAASEAGRHELAAEPEPEPLLSDPLLAFLHQAQGDPLLQQALAQAPDAAAVVALAQQAGYPLAAADLWAASEAPPEELAPLPADAQVEEEARRVEEALEGFLRQLEADVELQQALAEAADAAAVALLAQAAGHPLREVDLWLLCDLEPQHLQPQPAPPPVEPEAALLALLHQAQADAQLQQELAAAEDAAALAAIARAAGYAIEAADLWRASGAEPEELQAVFSAPEA